MLKLQNGKDAQGEPTHEKTGLFFPQFIPVPGPLSGYTQLMLVPGSGIPMRDYFAAKALLTCLDSYCGGEIDTARGVADWCYRIADAMLTARLTAPAEKPEEKGFPYTDGAL